MKTNFSDSPTPGWPGLRCVLAAGFFALATAVQALILVGKGNAPVQDPGWPPGSLPVANLPFRVGWTEGPPFGGGQWTFLYRGTTAALQETLNRFSAIQAEKRKVILHEGPATHHLLAEAKSPGEATCDWSFEVWVAEHWNHLFNGEIPFMADHPNFRQPLPPPILEIWLTPGLDWAQIQCPANLTLWDARATAHGFAPGSGSVISVAVEDIQTSRPVAKPRLVVASRESALASKASKEAIGDGAGRVVLEGIPAGSSQVYATAEGYVPRLMEYAQIKTNEYREYTVKLAPPAGLRGAAKDENDRPLPGAVIQAQHFLGPDGKGYPVPAEMKTVSDAQGNFEFTGLPLGRLQLWAAKPGYHHQRNPRDLEAATLPGSKEISRCVVRLVATGSVQVQLVDAGGKAVPPKPEGQTSIFIQEAARTGVGSWGGSAYVRADGSYEFQNVPPGKYLVSDQPLDGGSGAEPVTIEVQAGKTASARIIRRP